MSTVRFVVEVEVERESGLFAGRDEIAEKVQEAIEAGIEDVDLSGLGANSDSQYSVVEFGLTEVDNKQLKAEWRENEHRVREALPGDAELRNQVKALSHEVREKVDAIRRLQREIDEAAEERETGRTNVYLQEGYHKPKEYLPDGEFDRIYFQFGERDDERFALQRTKQGLVEIRMDGMSSYEMMVSPYSGNVLHIVPVPKAAWR